MAKNYFRIDDRLIHGQIVTAWCGHLKIGEIIAIDDKLAGNKTLQSIMLMGIPSQYKAHVVTSGEAKALFAQGSDKNRLFVIDLTTGERTDISAAWDQSCATLAWDGSGCHRQRREASRYQVQPDQGRRQRVFCQRRGCGSV